MHLDHTVVPSHDSQHAAAFYEDILGLENLGYYSPFYAVAVDDYLKLLFINKEQVDSRHYAFIVSEQEYELIFNRIQSNPTIDYGDSPSDRHNQQIYHSDKRTGFYFDDDDGHILEVIKIEH